MKNFALILQKLEGFLFSILSSILLSDTISILLSDTRDMDLTKRINKLIVILFTVVRIWILETQ